ncbi:MAG TPA: transposase, partial [Vicinamibacterales bacterium]|nr:transposase [Vicinamibacterales bacterium]
MEIAVCQSCESLRVQLRDTLASLAAAQEKLAEREAKIQQFSIQLREALKLIDLQRADLLRYRADPEPTRPRMEPNVPERVDREQLQKAFERVLAAQPELAANVANDDAISPRDADATLGRAATPKKGKQPRKHHPHGRRSLDLSKLPVERIEFDPPEVIASNGVGWMRIGEEVSHRVGYRPAQYFDLQIVRTKWARIVLPLAAAIPEGEAADETPEPAPIIVAPVPENVWPRIMGDPSAIANVIISKYGDSLPLNRQEQISVRHGFELPRSTQCDWLLAARQASYRIVDAMHAEARNRAFCIATDATGVEVRAKGGCDRWHLFVFIADCDHIIFDHAPSHDGATVTRMMKDFTGYVLADAAGIYNTLYDDHDMTEVACWYHARRYFWRGLASDRERALEPLALIAKLFQIDRECRSIVMPERTQMR